VRYDRAAELEAKLEADIEELLRQAEEAEEKQSEDNERDDEKPPKKIRYKRLWAMSEKIRNEEGRRIYAKRKSTVEPTFGIIKAPMGFRQFLLRGRGKVSTEWTLVCTAYNLKRLWALRPD
jgi:hypothetical protein